MDNASVQSAMAKVFSDDPAFKTTFVLESPQEMHFQSANQGIVQKDNVGTCYKTTIKNDGDLQTVNVTCPPTSGDVQVKIGNVKQENSNGLVLRSPNGNCWNLRVNVSGELARTIVSCSADSNVILEGSDLFLSGENNGLILHADNNTCWILNLDLESNLTPYLIKC